ncbi:hypothetical protein HQ585_14195 [candidate division KSB1 bacterium]|nr:hypothetical protein [candidate division KSB1 bacterium]
MKTFKWIFCLLIPLCFTGCLTVDTIKTTIDIQDEDKPAVLTIRYEGLSSAEGLLKDVKKDFNYLIEEWQGDEYLLERADEGILVRDRQLLIEDNKINSVMIGLVQDLDDLYDIWEQNGERILMVEFDDDDFELTETNGYLLKTEKNRLIVWPSHIKQMQWTMKRVFESESIDKNRPMMLKMFKEYLKKNPK